MTEIMTTRSSLNWQSTPGSLDKTKAAQTFPSSNRYGIPDLQPVPLSKLPLWLAPYRTRIRSNEPTDDGAIHFFLDDYRFESVWSAPRKALRYLNDFHILLSPDFSLYLDMPPAIQIWNTYRNRWCGCYWQKLGYTVIPTVSWSDGKSHDFAFNGVPEQSVVAISATGLHNPLSKALFAEGYRAMLRQLRPSAVLCYGSHPTDLETNTPIYTFPTRWDNIRKARANGRTREQ